MNYAFRSPEAIIATTYDIAANTAKSPNSLKVYITNAKLTPDISVNILLTNGSARGILLASGASSLYVAQV